LRRWSKVRVYPLIFGYITNPQLADATKFKNADEAFSKRFESRQALESYISRVEEMISDPMTAVRLKRGQKEKIEGALSDAMAQLEIEDAGADDLRKKVSQVASFALWGRSNRFARNSLLSVS
jgi:molecular chaperone DnaK (HSP70)